VDGSINDVFPEVLMMYLAACHDAAFTSTGCGTSSTWSQLIQGEKRSGFPS
jgi:hypothetical protein